MTYKQIIEKNCGKYSPNWWPKYAYHFTDVTNTISILSSGMLFSRAQATRKGIMGNDNASKQVIDITATRTTSYARFYFRPLTPTQYHNEGFKHAQLRYDGDVNANIPVPVFLVFDLDSLLKAKGVLFSARSQAGYGSPVYEGEEDFSKLPFDKIYSNGPCDNDTRLYRHAEILCPDYYQIDDSLRMILCRNECEKATLLNLLYSKDQKAYFKYKGFIRVAREKIFQRNGLYVDNVVYHQDTIAFEFACTPEKRAFENWKNIQSPLSPIGAHYDFRWINKQETTIYSTFAKDNLDYLKPRTVMFKLPKVLGAHSLIVTLTFDGKIVCVFKQSIDPFEMM